MKKFELKHELDYTMVDRAFRNRGGRFPHKTYITHYPENGAEGTDLAPEDCDEDVLDEQVDTSQGYTPAQPTLVATGDFFEENPEDNDPYHELEVCEVCFIKCLW
mgnify:CR=1 FL=1